MASSYEASTVYVHGLLRFRSVGHDTPVTLPPDGILVIGIDQAAHVVLANGSVLKGIRVTFEGDPQPIMANEWDDDDACMLVLCAEDGGVITCVHNALSVVQPVERLHTSDGTDVMIDNRHVQIFSRYLPSVSGRRWRVNKWG